MGRYAWLEKQGLIRICLLSFIMHLMVFGGAYGLVSLGSIDKRAEMPIVKTRLVKLGKKRDPKLLPRIAPKKEQQQPKPAPKPKETVPEPPPTKKKEKGNREIEKNHKRVIGRGRTGTRRTKGAEENTAEGKKTTTWSRRREEIKRLPIISIGII